MTGLEVLAPGALTTLQDWPGRLGFWEVGVPPSGPMDERSFRIGNRLVGNPQGAPGLEVTLTGPHLRFERDVTVAITGAPLSVTIGGDLAPQWAPLEVPAGELLALGAIRGVGVRAYVLVGGGIRAEVVMGSAASFGFSALCGRPLARGDRLELGDDRRPNRAHGLDAACLGAQFSNEATLRVVLGPHGAPDFLTPDGLAELLDGVWTVHHQSDRTGIRLLGPQPAWARADGGDAGLHPSNILDSAYGVGTVMLAGDMAVIVGPDGPSLGGFVAIAQVIRADLWRLGQLRAGDRVALAPVERSHASALHRAAEVQIAGRPVEHGPGVGGPPRRGAYGDGALVRDGVHGTVTYRYAGERAVLVEFGEPVLDLRSRVRAQTLRDALEREAPAGVYDLTPGVRSLHVHHDPDVLSAAALIDVLARLEGEGPAPEEVEIAARVVHLPLAWRHSEAMRAVERYQSSVRHDAPWCPDNIDFIRRINDLPDEQSVAEIVLAASYLVVGLGDVYLGAPVAVPLDPRHRLVTTKYTPARTWTPANAVGIGGAFLCVYGMEGPGGYQLVGRTVPVWHASDDPPWRLRHFDQLRFALVEESELEALRADSCAGTWAPRTEPASFSLREHARLLEENAAEIAAFTARRQAAFAAERRAWEATAEALA